MWITVMTPLVVAEFRCVVNLSVNMRLTKTGVTLTMINERLRHLVSERMTDSLSGGPDALRKTGDNPAN